MMRHEISNNHAKYEVLNEQYLGSILDVSAIFTHVMLRDKHSVPGLPVVEQYFAVTFK